LGEIIYILGRRTMNELALFAGAGGGILGGKLLGWRTVCAVEWEPYPASVLCARQNDGLLPPFPIWDDVQTFDGKPWRGIVDVVSGGFPCQDISAAGKGAGIDGERSGMWGQMARIICEVRPRYVFVENSPMLTSRGLGRVLGDLASMGFNARWGVLGAADVGANHQRDRIWIVGKMAYPTELFSDGGNNNSRISMERETQSKFGNNSGKENMANTSMSGFTPCNHQTSRPQQQLLEKQFGESSYEYGKTKHWWETEPNVGRVVDGMASQVDRLKAIGNGQVPLCAASAWRILNELE
jgi:DNA (cytosine-5)-methyltransferase 1